MQLDTLTFCTFIGGQLEIQDRADDVLFRGEIAGAQVEGTLLRIRFVWCAKNDGNATTPSPNWTNSRKLDHVVNLDIYRANTLDSGRLCLDSAVVEERCQFYPDGYKDLDGVPTSLDRARVKPSS